MLNLTLPYPPSVNDYYGRGPRHVYVKAPGVAYRRKVLEAVQRLTLAAPSALAPFQLAPLAVRVVLNPPAEQTEQQRQDVDNGNKALLDALSKAKVWRDDRQVKLQLNVIGEPVAGGSVTVTIAQLDSVVCYFDEVLPNVANG